MPFGVGMVVSLGVFLGLRRRLPEPLGTHFGAGTGTNECTSQGGFVVLCVLVFAAGALGFAGLSGLDGGRARWLLIVGYGTAGTVGSATLSTLLVNAVWGTGAGAHLPLWHLALDCAVGAALAILGGRLLRRLTPLPA